MPITVMGGLNALMNAAALAMAAKGILDDSQKNSLSAYTRDTQVSSRVYIDGVIAPDEVTPNIVRAAHSLYVSMILNALQLSKMVSNTHTVKENLKVIATEGVHTAHEDLGSSFGAFCGTESITSDVAELDGMTKDEHEAAKRERERAKWVQEDKEYEKERKRLPSLTSKPIAMDDSGTIPQGRIVEVTFQNPENPQHEATVNLLIQMYPYIIKPTLSVEFIKLNALPSLLQRYTQWRAGEIKFWRDLILHMDLIANKRKVMVNDSDNLLYDYLNTQFKKRRRSIISFWNALTSGQKSGERNIANSVLIFSEETVARAKVEVGFDLHNANDRSTYFDHTFSMMIFVVDPMYNRVTLYINGIESTGTYTFDQFKPKGRGNDVGDLAKILEAVSKGGAPRF